MLYNICLHYSRQINQKCQILLGKSFDFVTKNGYNLFHVLVGGVTFYLFIRLYT